MSFKYHKQFRLPEFDYSSNNAYFITVITKDRERFFGEIIDNKFFPTELGVFVQDNFNQIKTKLPHLRISEYIVMPDHIHFLAIIKNEESRNPIYNKVLQPLVPKSISSFTNQFKGAVTKWAHKNGFEGFRWLPRFHDRIVRNKEEYFAIKNYIKNNIKNWDSEKDDLGNPYL